MAENLDTGNQVNSMINVRFFAALREQLDSNEVSIPAASIQNVADVKAALIKLHPDWKTHLGSTLILNAVNHHMVDIKHSVNQGDEVAFFPPVTGG